MTPKAVWITSGTTHACLYLYMGCHWINDIHVHLGVSVYVPYKEQERCDNIQLCLVWFIATQITSRNSPRKNKYSMKQLLEDFLDASSLNYLNHNSNMN